MLAHAEVEQGVGGQAAAALADALAARVVQPQARAQAPGALPLQLRVQHLARAAGQFHAGVAVFGAQQGKVVVPLEAGGEGPAQAQLRAAHGGAVYVVVLVGDAHQPPHALAVDFAEIDQVFDAGVKQRAAQRKRPGGVVGPHFKRGGAFGLDAGVAQEGVRAFGAHVVGRYLLERGRLERAAHAAFDDEVFTRLPDQVGAGADVVAKDLVMVHPHAQRGDEVAGKGEFILRKQGLVRGAVFAAGQPGVDEFFAPPFAAGGEAVAAHAPLHEAIAHHVAHVLRARGRNAVGAVRAYANGAAVGAQLRFDVVAENAVPLAVAVVAIDFVGVVVGRGPGAARHVVVEAVFAAVLNACLEGVAGVERVARREAAGSAPAAFDFAIAPVFAQGHGIDVAALGIDAQRQPLRHGAARVHSGFAARAAPFGAAGALAGEADRAFPFVGGPAGDDVHHAAQRLGAIQGRERAANDFHPLNGGGGNPAVLVIRVAHHVVRGGNAAAIHEHQRVRIVHAAQGEGFAPAHLARRKRQARRVFNQGEQVFIRAAALLQRLAVKHRDGSGRGAGVFFAARGRHGHLRQHGLLLVFFLLLHMGMARVQILRLRGSGANQQAGSGQNTETQGVARHETSLLLAAKPVILSQRITSVISQGLCASGALFRFHPEAPALDWAIFISFFSPALKRQP